MTATPRCAEGRVSGGRLKWRLKERLSELDAGWRKSEARCALQRFGLFVNWQDCCDLPVIDVAYAHAPWQGLRKGREVFLA